MIGARVILLAGPSGCGKSHLAAASGLPVLALDDFYREGTDPNLPRLPGGGIDWDHPASWDHAGALAALLELATAGRTEVPVYSIPRSAVTGRRTLALAGEPILVAEGIFVATLIGELAGAGVLERAIVVRRPRSLTFLLRLGRDLRENRKSPAFLLRRGLLLARRERAIVADLRAAGCSPMAPRAVRRFLATFGSVSAPADRTGR